MNFKPKCNKWNRLVALIGTFTLEDVVGHHWDSDMEGGDHPIKCMDAH
jgi:hypothetical protein